MLGFFYIFVFSIETNTSKAIIPITGLSRDISVFLMCTSPILIPNPNCGLSPKPGSVFCLRDCTSQFIQIPCGHCADCIAIQQMSLVQRCQMEAINHHLFFTTLTYNEDSMPHLVTSNGVDLRFADISDLQNMFKRLRKSNAFGRPFRYLAVSERGSKKARPHFHILWFVPKHDTDDSNDVLNLEQKLWYEILHEWRRNYGSSRKPIYRPLCTYARKFYFGRWHTNYDTHAVLPWFSSDGVASVTFYISKYILKVSEHEVRLQQALRMNLDDEEYIKTWKLIRSRRICSRRFGSPDDPDVQEYLRSCIDKSLYLRQDYPCFYNPDTGQQFPLCRYYRGKDDIYSLKHAYGFYYQSDKKTIDSPYYLEPDFDRHDKSLVRLSRVRDTIEHRGDFADIDMLFE